MECPVVLYQNLTSITRNILNTYVMSVCVGCVYYLFFFNRFEHLKTWWRNFPNQHNQSVVNSLFYKTQLLSSFVMKGHCILLFCTFWDFGISQLLNLIYRAIAIKMIKIILFCLLKLKPNTHREHRTTGRHSFSELQIVTLFLLRSVPSWVSWLIIV